MKDRHIKDAELDTLRQQRIVELERKAVLQQKMGELNARLAAIVENSNDAIIGKDLNGVITSWNKGAEIIYGYTAEEAIGRPISMLFPSGNTDEISIILDKIKRGVRLENYEAMRVGKDGRQICISLSVSPIKDSNGELTGASTIARDITRRKQLEEALRKSEERLSLALEAANDGVWDWGINGEAYLSPKYSEMTGYANDEIRPGLDFFKSIIHPEDIELVMKTMKEHMEGLTEQSIVEYRMITKRGECKHILGKGKVVERDEKGNPVRMIGTISDITERKKAEEQIRLAQKEWEQTFDAMPDIVAVIDNQHVIRQANSALAIRLGIERDALIGRCCYTTICGQERALPNCPGTLATVTDKEHMEERFVERLNGHFHITCTPISVCDEHIPCFVEVCRDITERKKMEEKLRAASITDALTRLLNRAGFFALAEQQVKLAERSKRKLLLLFLDLNNLKEINDNFGHKEGDQALIETAELLKGTFRDSDIVARMGGDEFVALLTEITGSDDERIILDHIQKNVRHYNEMSKKTGRKYELSLSIGTAFYDSEQPCSIDNLIATADARMYEEKKQYKSDRRQNLP